MNGLNKMLSEIEARCEKATPGPWEYGMSWDRVGREQRNLDEIFMINARTDIPRLVAALRKAIEQRDDLLGGLVRSDLEHLEEYRVEQDTELSAILAGKDVK